MLGYSRPGDPDQAAYIVMEGTATYHLQQPMLMSVSTAELFFDRLHSLYGTSKLLAWSQQVTSDPANGA